MRKHFLILLSLFLVLGLLSAQLTITPKTFVFKEVPSGEVITASFMLKNNTEALIKIKNIRTTCGCTTVAKNPDQLEPGESFNLQVRLSTAGYRGDISKQIYVYADSDFNPIILKIMGKIKPQPSGLLKVETLSLKLGLIGNADKIERTVTVTNTGNKELEILQLTHPPFFLLTLDKIKLKPNESTKIRIKVLPTIHGKGVKSIRLLTDSLYDKYKWFRITYQVN